MDDNASSSLDTQVSQRQVCSTTSIPALDFLVKIPQRFHSLKSHFKHLAKDNLKISTTKTMKPVDKESGSPSEIKLDEQLQAWKENSNWVAQPPEIKVSVPKGSLCNLNAKFKVGLPPDAVYNIVTDPGNKRVFKNIKEVISRKVLIDEGHRQVVEVEQAAIWRFLWWSGTISVHVFVDQNRSDHTVKFKQGKSGFMEKFEGRWKFEPVFVDGQSCTGGRGRVASMVSLEQLIQPAIVPPPPISWYLRGITRRTTEVLIDDLVAEAARLRRVVSNADSSSMRFATGNVDCVSRSFDGNIKERWRQRRNARRKQIR